MKKNKEAQSRGGRVATADSVAKAHAVAAAHAAKRAKAKARQSGLVVPAPFANAGDFLLVLAGITKAMPFGANAEIARQCQVSTSTISKWLRGAKVPIQTNLDGLVAWYRSNHANADRLASPATAAQVPRVKRETPTVSLARLPEAIGIRLRKTARMRGISPVDYAAQILDRHLPKIEMLE